MNNMRVGATLAVALDQKVATATAADSQGDRRQVARATAGMPGMCVRHEDKEGGINDIEEAI